ncbi:hypothetical protein ACTQ50_03560 [Blautia sp. Sow4_E7]|uniref:hypothetical protein n=1 Tax=Blautia sp. Sow4_E7 TaxID=3438749 RepID=UPI003F8E84C6
MKRSNLQKKGESVWIKCGEKKRMRRLFILLAAVLTAAAAVGLMGSVRGKWELLMIPFTLE